MSPTVVPEDEQVWRAYIEASIRLETRLDETLRAGTGLTLIDYHLLLLLADAPQQRLRMSELADRMVFSRSRITYQVTSMAKRGLVVREPVPDDGRGFRAVLTATGLDAVRSASHQHAASVKKLFLDNIRPDELTCIGAVFTRLRSHLENEPLEAP